ncbi:hypothetical protein [Streptomyces sp. NRRL F-2664]|uniref:hypothetical protein n=1 Tax=Streptomyces sp. NRRL F-2664 TaxID=1463842 RepID=UPI000A7AA172|nr:hypothetical protein [Streptomyces sp. NRRL F-2664]
MSGHPVHPDQPAQPTQSVHFPDPGPRFAAPARRSLHPSVRPSGRPDDDPAGDVVRWAAFSCLLVPVVLVVYGTSLGGAAVATLGLFVVTAACLVLLRHSERAAARVRAQERPLSAHRRRHSRAAGGGRHGCRTSGSASPHE